MIDERIEAAQRKVTEASITEREARRVRMEAEKELRFLHIQKQLFDEDFINAI